MVLKICVAYESANTNNTSGLNVVTCKLIRFFLQTYIQTYLWSDLSLFILQTLV